MFIAIEGGDGSGKATHAAMLSDYLRLRGKNVYQIAFPRYGKDSAYYIEKYLNGSYGKANDVPAELGTLPYALDRYAARNEILSHLGSQDDVVVADRYMASNLAHQGAKIDDAAARSIFYERTKLTEYNLLEIPRPDINIVLVMPVEHAQKNVDKKAKRDYTDLKRDVHEADADHLEKAKANFEELCEKFPEEFKRVLCTDESGSMRPIQSIQDDIRNNLGL